MKQLQMALEEITFTCGVGGLVGRLRAWGSAPGKAAAAEPGLEPRLRALPTI